MNPVLKGATAAASVALSSALTDAATPTNSTRDIQATSLEAATTNSVFRYVSVLQSAGFVLSSTNSPKGVTNQHSHTAICVEDASSSEGFKATTNLLVKIHGLFPNLKTVYLEGMARDPKIGEEFAKAEEALLKKAAKMTCPNYKLKKLDMQSSGHNDTVSTVLPLRDHATSLGFKVVGLNNQDLGTMLQTRNIVLARNFVEGKISEVQGISEIAGAVRILAVQEDDQELFLSKKEAAGFLALKDLKGVLGGGLFDRFPKQEGIVDEQPILFLSKEDLGYLQELKAKLDALFQERVLVERTRALSECVAKAGEDMIVISGHFNPTEQVGGRKIDGLQETLTAQGAQAIGVIAQPNFLDLKGPVAPKK